MGVPESTPDVERVRPGGSVPDVRVKVGGGKPVAVKVKLKGAPAVTVGGGGLLVITGSAPWVDETVALQGLMLAVL